MYPPGRHAHPPTRTAIPTGVARGAPTALAVPEPAV